jgi:TRAP-type C4-dicarboxylate transport system permease small subunit
VSATKNAINSTFRKILNYTAEIIMSVFLLIIICIPLVFTIPMWLQFMLTNVPIDQLPINPVEWFGYEGTFWLTLFLGLISSSVGYAYIIKIKPGVTTSAEEEPAAEIREPVEKRVEEIAAEDIEEEIAAEDQEDIEEFDIEGSEESSEDIEDYE